MVARIGMLFAWPLIAEENSMRKIVSVAGLAAVLILAVSGGFAQNKTSKGGAGQIVIVFKDGHRQSFNLGDIARVEFPGGAVADSGAASSNGVVPPRGHFFGRWETGDGNGGSFYITLKEDGTAYRSLGGNVHGKWAYVNGEALITWDDGAMDAIRKVGSRDKKYAYHEGKKFTDEPDNVTDAKNTSPRPI
jgi:hypothetical protein